LGVKERKQIVFLYFCRVISKNKIKLVRALETKKGREKQPFEEICIYEDGIGFVTVLGRQEKVNFDQVYVHYGAYQKSVYIDCALLGISAKNIPWNYFSQPDVLHKNLQRYANWNIGKYKKK